MAVKSPRVEHNISYRWWPAKRVIGIASSWEVTAPEELGVLEQAWLQSALYAVQTMEEVHGTLYSALQVFRGTFAFFFTCRLGIRAAVGRRHVAFLGHVTCILIGPFSRCLGFGCDTLIVYFILFQYYINGDVYGCILELNVDRNSIRKNVQPSAEGT